MLHPLRVLLLFQLSVDLLQHFFQVSHQRDIRADVLVDLRIVDINVQYFGMFREFLRITHHTVGESGPHRDQQVALADAEIGNLRAVHTDHARIARVMAVEYALTHKRITDRRIHPLSERPHFFVGA